MILPTPGERFDETQRLFEESQNRLLNASKVLGQFLRGNGDPEAEANALQTKNFIDVFIEAAGELADDVANPDPPTACVSPDHRDAGFFWF